MRKNRSETTIDEYIIDVTKRNSPKTLKELIKLIQLKHPLPEKEILEHVAYLQKQGKIVLKKHQTSVTPLLKRYIFSTEGNWYWTTITLAAVTATLALTVPENAFPIVYARYVFGFIFILFLPGYSLIKVLFPTKELDNIERVSLSIGISLVLVPIVGLLLNYTPWGIRTTPVTLSLLALTIVLATTAIIREQKAKLRESQHHIQTKESV